MADIITARLPLLGIRSDHREALVGGFAAAAVTVSYVLVASGFGTSTTLIEALSVWASLACVWLARTENIWTMPYGLVAVVLLGWYLLDIELVAQGWLQYVYYVPIQIIGWWAWARGGNDRTELPVTSLTMPQWAGVIALLATLWLGLWFVFDAVYDESSFLTWDTSIVASSVVAQSLMTWKKKESWWWWTLPVNVSSIGLFARTEVWAFVFLYVVFLVNSVWGWSKWQKAAQR